MEIDFEPKGGRIEIGYVYVNTATKVSTEGVLRTQTLSAIPFPLREIVSGALTPAA